MQAAPQEHRRLHGVIYRIRNIVIRFARKYRLLAAPLVLAPLALAPLALGVLPIAAVAQSDGFNFPTDINFLRQPDPNMRRATARVNGNIITGTDVDHRVALIVASNETPVSPEDMQGLRLQVLRNLIDETLQVQEAVAQDMEVTSDEVNDSYANFALERFNRTPEEMDAYLTMIGASARTLKRQIQGEMAWDRLLRRNVTPFIRGGERTAGPAAGITRTVRISHRRNLHVGQCQHPRAGAGQCQPDHQPAAAGRLVCRGGADLFRSVQQGDRW
jgi:hypothetical protein